MNAELAAKTAGATLPLDEVAWQAWIAKNRRAEKLLNARIARIALLAAAATLILATSWLASYFGIIHRH